MSHYQKRHKPDPWYPPQAILDTEPCAACGKAAYSSRHSAKSQIKRLDRDNRRRGRTDALMHIYECPHGNGWHIAHAKSQGQRTGSAPRAARRERQFAAVAG